MQLEHDIVERIQRDFGPGDDTRAIEILTESRQTGRVARCIVVAAKGSIESLKDHIELAQFDFPDAVVAGEYDGAKGRVRDFRASFRIDSPERMWISEVAAALHARGYTLTAIETRVASVGPFQNTSEHNEGVACFAGSEGPVEIEKRDGKWALRTHHDDLPLYRANCLFDDEVEFRDAVSCFLLAKQRPHTPVNRSGG